MQQINYFKSEEDLKNHNLEIKSYDLSDTEFITNIEFKLSAPFGYRDKLVSGIKYTYDKSNDMESYTYCLNYNDDNIKWRCYGVLPSYEYIVPTQHIEFIKKYIKNKQIIKEKEDERVFVYSRDM